MSETKALLLVMAILLMMLGLWKVLEHVWEQKEQKEFDGKQDAYIREMSTFN